MKYAEALPEGFNVPTSAFWLRKDLETNPFKLVPLEVGDRIMDCGTYIGTFAAAAMEQGAASVVCYEAAPKNFLLAVANMARYGERAKVVEKALTAGHAKTVQLSMSSFSGANSILPSANRPKALTVVACNFSDELMLHRPTIVKIDVEGAEYDLLGSLKPGELAGVRCLFVEFHPIDDREAKIAAIRAYFEAEGFTVLSDRKRAFVVVRKAA